MFRVWACIFGFGPELVARLQLWIAWPQCQLSSLKSEALKFLLTLNFDTKNPTSKLSFNPTQQTRRRMTTFCTRYHNQFFVRHPHFPSVKFQNNSEQSRGFPAIVTADVSRFLWMTLQLHFSKLNNTKFGDVWNMSLLQNKRNQFDYHMNFLAMFGVVLQLHCEESLMLVSTIICRNPFFVAEQVSWPLFTGFNVLVFMNKRGISLVNLCFIASIVAEHQILFPIISRPY